MASVQEFGAVGDGLADDTDAIQHAIDELSGSIVLPPGSYRLTRTIQIALDEKGPISLNGSGGTARLVMAGEGPALWFKGTHAGTAAPASVLPAVWQRQRLPIARDLEIVGENLLADGIRLEGTMQATLGGLLIRRCRYGVHLTGRNRNLLLADCHLYDGQPGGIGVFYDRVNLHQSNIIGCHISYWPQAGLKVLGGEVRNMQVTGCDIEYNHDPEATDSADLWIDAREGTVREVTIASNTIQALESPGGSNVRIDGADDPGLSRSAGLITIAGNVLQSQAVNLRLTSCRGIAVTGNSFASGFERSIVMEKARDIAVGSCTIDHNPDYKGARIDGIVIRDSHVVSLTGLVLQSTQAGSEDSGGAIAIERSRGVVISGCQIHDPAFRGIHLADVDGVVISGSIIDENRSEPLMREAILQTGRNTRVSIQGNLLGKEAEPTARIELNAGHGAAT